MRTPGDEPAAGGVGGGTGPAGGNPPSGGRPHVPEAGEAEAGRVLAGRYRLTGRLGRGGMGVVWRAVDEVLGREVAVKELRTFSDAGAGELAELRTRMQREARAAARVRHGGVVSVHDVAQHDGRPVIVMELVEGRSLDDVLRERGTLEPREAAEVGAKVMGALAAAHRAGVLHRDVKPGNVLLESASDRVVLTDFGIAAIEDPDDGAATQLTGSGELVGSLDYLAPERARGEAPSEACDVWALGATLYAAVEGAAPFRRTSTWSTLNAIVVEPLPEPRRAGPLAPVLAELLEKDPRKRAGAERATALLEAVAKGEQPPADPSATLMLGRAGRGDGGRADGAGAPQPAQPAYGHGRFGTPPPQADAHGHGGHGGHSGHLGTGTPAPGVPGAAPGTGGGEGGTDRHTVRTRGEQSGGGRRAVIAAAAALVVLTGAGVAYAVAVSGGDDPAPGSRAAGKTGEGGQQGAGRRGGSVPEKGGSSPDGRPKKTARAGGAGGAPGTGKPGGGGRADGGAKGGSGGSNGGTSTGGSVPAPGGGGGGSTGGGNGGGRQRSCHPRGDGEFDCTVWKQARSFNARHEPVGRLDAGVNYFYCQKKLPHRETSGRWTNVWWAKTDDDTGNKGVFVSDVYIKGGKNNKPVPGLPRC